MKSSLTTPSCKAKLRDLISLLNGANQLPPPRHPPPPPPPRARVPNKQTGSKHESETQFLRSFGRYGDFVMSLGAGDSFGEESMSSKEGLADNTAIVASDVAELLYWRKEDYDMIMQKVESSIVFRPE